MPPKCKFTKEEILKAALDFVREEGMEALTARALGKRLSSSPKPIFSVYENMEELQKELLRAARGMYDRYVEQGLSMSPAFKGVGMAYIRFAVEEPKLFQLLFMEEQKEQKDALGTLPLIDDNYSAILSSVMIPYNVGEEDAQMLYRHLWIYTHGIASLIAAKVCRFSEGEIDRMLTEIFKSLLLCLKEGKL